MTPNAVIQGTRRLCWQSTALPFRVPWNHSLCASLNACSLGFPEFFHDLSQDKVQL